MDGDPRLLRDADTRAADRTLVYLYATDIEGADVLKGTVSMCIDRGKFKVFGIENCWRRGLQAVDFRRNRHPGFAGLDDVSHRARQIESLALLQHAMASSDNTSLSRLDEVARGEGLRPLEKIGDRARRLGALHVLGDRVDQRQRRGARRRGLGRPLARARRWARPRGSSPAP